MKSWKRASPAVETMCVKVLRKEPTWHVSGIEGKQTGNFDCPDSVSKVISILLLPECQL